VRVWLGRARYKRERELVDRLVEEGHDPLEIAAAALKLARGEEKKRPIVPVAPVQDFGPRFDRRDVSRGPRRGAFPLETVSHEPGMVRLSLSMGREHGLRPNDVVGTIAAHAEIPGSTIGKIHIQDKYTLVDVPEKFAAKVLALTETCRIRQYPVHIKLA
jgi:ATP-dependent RNA helicase DeaD